MSDLGIRGGRIVTRADKRPVAADKHCIAVKARAGARGKRAHKLRVRLTDEARRKVVLDAAYELAKGKGLASLSWPSIAANCEQLTSAITARRTFQSLVALRAALIERAESENTEEARQILRQARQFGLIEASDE
jgi:hypothetical protein